MFIWVTSVSCKNKKKSMQYLVQIFYFRKLNLNGLLRNVQNAIATVIALRLRTGGSVRRWRDDFFS